jgi:hypothetical protein
MENLQKCICKTCPVQAESVCAKQKKMKVQKMMESKMLPDAEMVAGVYCATGKSSCGDLDFSKMCQCNECPLWEECDLISGQPMGYYCRDGQAE